MSCDLTFKPSDFPPDFLFDGGHFLFTLPELFHVFRQLLKCLPVFLRNVDKLCFTLLFEGDNHLAMKFSLFATARAASARTFEIEERAFEKGGRSEQGAEVLGSFLFQLAETVDRGKHF